MSDIHLSTAFGDFKLHRFPSRKHELLRAWDAADEYLLQSLAGLEVHQQNILIVNDAFGALGVCLHAWKPVSWSDSWLAFHALDQNLVNNHVDSKTISTLPATDTPCFSPSLVLIKVPKSLALLEDQLLRLKPLLTESSRIIVAGMVKTMPSSLWKLLERLIGPTQTSLAQKKARLIEASIDTAIELPENPYPVKWRLEGTALELSNHANVFSRAGLDIGSRFLLQHLPQSPGFADIVDLGCGNGVLGLVAGHQNAEARVHFVDESYMAIASARTNFRQIDPQLKRAEFQIGDGLASHSRHSADLILCNPPFHQSHTIGDTLALNMFKQSARVLRENGQLWVVGNRHLNYHRKLRKWFKQVDLIASNRKFVILKAALN